jgi:hypothetical protein
MHLVCQVSAPTVANIATFELPGRLSYFYLASLLGEGEGATPQRGFALHLLANRRGCTLSNSFETDPRQWSPSAVRVLRLL